MWHRFNLGWLTFAGRWCYYLTSMTLVDNICYVWVYAWPPHFLGEYTFCFSVGLVVLLSCWWHFGMTRQRSLRISPSCVVRWCRSWMYGCSADDLSHFKDVIATLIFENWVFLSGFPNVAKVKWFRLDISGDILHIMVNCVIMICDTLLDFVKSNLLHFIDI